MKEQLINLSREKGFMNRDNLVTVYDSYYPLWMCELQKWLREVHGIVAIVKPDGQSDAYDYYIKTRGTDISKWLRTKEIYPTYELALESALQEALNLIQTKP